MGARKGSLQDIISNEWLNTVGKVKQNATKQK